MHPDSFTFSVKLSQLSTHEWPSHDYHTYKLLQQHIIQRTSTRPATSAFLVAGWTKQNKQTNLFLNPFYTSPRWDDTRCGVRGFEDDTLYKTHCDRPVTLKWYTLVGLSYRLRMRSFMNFNFISFKILQILKFPWIVLFLLFQFIFNYFTFYVLTSANIFFMTDKLTEKQYR